MRRFLCAVLATALFLLGAWYAVYYCGFYFFPRPAAPPTVTMSARDGQFFAIDASGNASPFPVRGVSLSSSLPGHAFSDYAPDEATYLRWLTQIGGMGANTVMVPHIMDDDFYNALYRHNAGTSRPLYLLQGLAVSDHANYSAQDASNEEFYGNLARDALDAVDVVHGKKNISLNRLRGSGRYRRDVSPWVLGYVVGAEWDPGIIAYTNNNPELPASYTGEYLATTDGATPFEALLARAMDRMVSYETEKYGAQRPVSFVNDPQNDPFEYNPEYGRQIGKYNCVDAERIVATQAYKAGYFASYRLYEFCGGFTEYFSTAQKRKLSGILPRLDRELYYEGYTQLLSAYHTVPVLISSYGFSTSRGLVRESQADAGPLSERQQGERLAGVYRDIVGSGCAGAVVSSWQDVWGQRTWNTSFAVDLADAARWHDLQTDGQGYGLLAFDPGQEGRVCQVDGDPSEWPEDALLAEKDGTRLYAQPDPEALYLMLRGAREDVTVYVPIDVSPELGSASNAAPPLQFSRAADFLLCLTGRADSRLLVQARYDALRENYLQELEGKDPFVSYPAADEASFVPIRTLLLPRVQVQEAAVLEDRRGKGTYAAWEAGRLVHGNGNPGAADYDSRADFCYGSSCVEVRLPWGLLNCSDPSEAQFHADYYAHYGVEHRAVSGIWLGLTQPDDEQPAAMAELPLTGWNSPSYRERLKQSYEILRREWS